jgi:tetratricopeptide (TPR) repeat protein
MATLPSQDEILEPKTPTLYLGHIKTRNHLRRLAKVCFDADRTEDFVRGYLMLADIFMSSAKHDHTITMCQEALKLDQACAMAWEMLLNEMRQRASQRHGVGYTLAFNYLKARRYTKANDVCQQVLRLFPDYPSIETDIVDVARAS